MNVVAMKAIEIDGKKYIKVKWSLWKQSTININYYIKNLRGLGRRRRD